MIALSLWLVFSSVVEAQDPTTTFTATCVPGSQQTSFPNCVSFGDYTTCAKLPTTRAWENCLCQQSYLDSLFGCESEMRLCYEDGRLDINYEYALSLWHSLCDTLTTFAPTTPALTTVSVSYDSFCGNQAAQACTTAQDISNSCNYAYTNDVSFSSCLCQPRFLSLDYECEFLGNTSCFNVPATMSNLVGYGCPNFNEIVGTGITAGAVITVTPTGSQSSATTPSPGGSSTASQTSTPSSKSEGARGTPFASGGALFAFLLLILVAALVV